jgi:hypothetical protein
VTNRGQGGTVQKWISVSFLKGRRFKAAADAPP